MSGVVHGVRATLGALLLGNVVSVFLFGIVTMQMFLYFRIYPRDSPHIKLIVGLVWLLDLLHSVMVSAASWSYLIDNFGNPNIADVIFWSVAVTIAFTAVITFIVHWFFCHKLLKLSRYNWFITTPIFILASTRLVFACVTTSRMIILGSFHEFTIISSFPFTAGLALATAVDLLIATGLIFFLNKNRTGFPVMDSIIHSITVYTIESGLLTCVVTVVSLVFWVTMSNNLVFLALHFAIGKLYANTFLATLNTRKSLRGRSRGSSDNRSSHPMPVLFPMSVHSLSRLPHFGNRHDEGRASTKLQINVEKTIEHDIEVSPEDSRSFTPTHQDDHTESFSGA